MAQIQLSEKVYQEFHAKAADYGFEAAEEFISYVLQELLMRMKVQKSTNNVDAEINGNEEELLKARLETLGYL